MFQLMAHEMLDQMILVCIIIAVVFASWPAFSCWLPGLTVFTVVSLSPVLLVLAAAYGVGEAAVSLILVVVAVCVLYCGRHFNDIVARGVIREAQNAQLVEKLRAEKSLAESERRRRPWQVNAGHGFSRARTMTCGSPCRRWDLSADSAGARDRLGQRSGGAVK